MIFNCTGTITEIAEVISGQTAKGEWKKRNFSLQPDSNSPKEEKPIFFTVFGSKMVDSFTSKVGDKVRLDFIINCNPSKTAKTPCSGFTELNVIKVTPA